MRRSILLIPAVLITAGFQIAATRTNPTDPTVVVVKMVDKSATEFVYEPANINVKPGDIVRFVQTSAMPHNVEFKKTPAGVDLGAARVGGFLTAPNQTYEIKIDAKFVKGAYEIACTPHEAMGMKATITVAAK